MDTGTLVEEQKLEAQRLINELTENGFVVDVAFWVQTSEEGLWFFYIASPEVDLKGLANAYRTVISTLSRLSLQWLQRSEIKLIGRENPIAVDAIEFRDPRIATRFHGRKLGSIIIEEAYIYAPVCSADV